VERGYDAMAERFAEWSTSFETPVLSWVADLLALVPTGGEILELGCGGGSAATRALAERHSLTGVDLSAAQIERARRLVPAGGFLQGDATTIALPADSYDAVVSLFMLGHVPRAEQGPLLARMADWLRPGGHLLVTLGIGDSEDAVEDEWLGVPMFFASFDVAHNRELLKRAGFELLRERIVPLDEPGHGTVSFMWVLGRKPLRG
jgi:cyclopropane fatty-acyl-phospholipid synthase-like methyltransferase